MIADLIRWNISRSGQNMASADACVVSFPKSGRTWLRVFYYSYLSNITGSEFTFEHENYAEFPRLAFTHDRWEHRFIPGWWDFIRGKHLIPLGERQTRPIILLARDPRDVVVSLYFHLSKRPHVFRWNPEPINRMVRCPRFGIETVIEIMNSWMDEWHGKENFCMLRYEDLQAGGEGFREFLNFLEFSPIDEHAFERAIEFSKFDKMHEIEAKGGFGTGMLVPGDPSDPDSFKVRRGKVGGFADYLTDDDIAFVNERMRGLDSRFGYGG